ncbi:hypothetical protein BJ875DRAFT_277256 [Amylocarpus encephaloides]|uniref:Zn(2)-C6 fungal-type domain-containing protein n=1 Tax=Amylocarpus encephaloides TaxID=45428 RepID=A0A9P7Y7D9_9HELO|nr:hypothetical protein BJ875DRAFT_277256 [Amylocarpus encephaloides]
MSNLPTPPLEDSKPPYVTRRPPKPSKQSSRTSKRTTTSHEHAHGPGAIDGRHKRVWKACERCRMKKTKCDGESPCKRCKDDGLVCTAGSRKKTEFKQLPRGYAEVLENTQYALIAAVQKLYTMVRNHESWELGEPEMNERGQPVIHDIASKLGCVRPSPDLSYAFPEGAEDFAELQAQLQAARSDLASEDTASSRKHSHDATYSPTLDRTDRASSSESDHSTMSREYNQMMWSQRQAASKAALAKANAPVSKPPSRPMDEESSYARTSVDTSRSMPSPIYTDFQTASPMLRNTSPFSPWSAGDDFLGPAHALDLTSHYMRPQPHMARSSPLAMQPEMMKVQFNDSINFAEGTIRPGMLDSHPGMELFEQMDVMYPTDYEGQLGLV